MISRQKMNEVVSSLEGLNYSEWKEIQSVVDYYYQQKSSQIRIDNRVDIKAITTLFNQYRMNVELPDE